MNDRQAAIRILEQARQALADRLTERILHAEEAILDDALGRRYLSEIDGIYDELGIRLAHVNNMLAHLPPADAETDESGAGLPGDQVWEIGQNPDPRNLHAPDLHTWSRDSALADDWSDEDRRFYDELPESSTARAFLALPAPRAATPVDPTRELHGFLRDVRGGNLLAAATGLALLFEIDFARAQRCADVFAVQAALRPELFTRAMQLKTAVQSSTVQSSAVGCAESARRLLYDCFGLDSYESEPVIKALGRRLGSLSHSPLR